MSFVSCPRRNALVRRTGTEATGFTLVELLVVIAIIGILVALLLPAVQAAREAARRAECKNHLKQLSLGCLLHVDTHKFLPSGGWASLYTADSNLGYGASQPAGWYFSILPYIEEQALHDLENGLDIHSAAFKAASIQLHQSTVSSFHCPSRRPVKLYQHNWGTIYEQTWIKAGAARVTSDVPEVTKGDFAANTGDSLTHAGVGFGADQFWVPASYDTLKSGPLKWTSTSCEANAAGVVSRFCQTGVIHYRSEIKPAQILDGSSNTYLIGEKFLSPDLYEESPSTGNARYSDNQGAWSGFEWDNQRVAWNPKSAVDELSYQPRQDTPGVDDPNIYAFGSAHSGAMNMAMCDGSVQSISYDIDRDTHRYLANRFDGMIAHVGQ